MTIQYCFQEESVPNIRRDIKKPCICRIISICLNIFIYSIKNQNCICDLLCLIYYWPRMIFLLSLFLIGWNLFSINKVEITYDHFRLPILIKWEYFLKTYLYFCDIFDNLPEKKCFSTFCPLTPLSAQPNAHLPDRGWVWT